jgi:hypothetical protein
MGNNPARNDPLNNDKIGIVRVSLVAVALEIPIYVCECRVHGYRCGHVML